MIIGLTGAQGVGKTTLAKVLEAEHGFKRINFADSLRAAASLIFNIQDSGFTAPELKNRWLPNWGKTPRQILQLLGTDVARAIHPDVWVRTWEWKVLEAWSNHWQNQAFTVVADDLRFDNEALTVRKLGGKIVRLTRLGYEAPIDAHITERGLSLPPDIEAVLPDEKYRAEYRRFVEHLLELVGKDGMLGK